MLPLFSIIQRKLKGFNRINLVKHLHGHIKRESRVMKTSKPLHQNLSNRPNLSKIFLQPYQSLETDLDNLYEDMRKTIVKNVPNEKFQKICEYYFKKRDDCTVKNILKFHTTLRQFFV